jgi:hypothetical protein
VRVDDRRQAILAEHHVRVAADSPFQGRLRLQQSLWRERQGAAEFAASYDDSERSPANELVAYLEEEGVDVSDQEARDAAVSAYNARQIALRMLE